MNFQHAFNTPPAPAAKKPERKRDDVAGDPSLLKALESVMSPADQSRSNTPSKGLPEGMDAKTAGRALASLFPSEEPTLPGFPSPLAAAETAANEERKKRLEAAETELMEAQRALAKVRATPVTPSTYESHQADVQQALENEHLALETYNQLRREALREANEVKAGLTPEQREARRANDEAIREEVAQFEARKKGLIESSAEDARKVEELRRAVDADVDQAFKRTFYTKG